MFGSRQFSRPNAPGGSARLSAWTGQGFIGAGWGRRPVAWLVVPLVALLPFLVPLTGGFGSKAQAATSGSVTLRVTDPVVAAWAWEPAPPVKGMRNGSSATSGTTSQASGRRPQPVPMKPRPVNAERRALPPGALGRENWRLPNMSSP